MPAKKRKKTSSKTSRPARKTEPRVHEKHPNIIWLLSLLVIVVIIFFIIHQIGEQRIERSYMSIPDGGIPPVHITVSPTQ